MSEAPTIRKNRATEVFKNIGHYKTVAGNIISHLCGGQSSDSYLYSGIEVSYIEGLNDEAIFFDHLRSKIVVQAPKSNLNESERRERTLFYISELSKNAEAMRVIGISEIYLALCEEGREEVSKNTI